MMLAAKYALEALGTSWSIETETPLSPQEIEYIHNTVDKFEAIYSRFRNDSLVCRIRQTAPGDYQFPDSIIELYDMYVRLEHISGGAINPLVGESLERLGYDADYSLAGDDTTPFIPPSFTQTVVRQDDTVSFKQPVLLDIGAIGKGYFVDVLAGIVGFHHAAYVIDGSGDVAVHTSVPDVIGLEDPRDPTRVLGTVQLQDKSLCASATNRRTWGNGLHHIIDATTGKSLDGDVLATWAITDTTMLADALATALFFVPVTTLRQEFGDFFYAVLRKDGSIEHNIQSIGELYI